MYAVIDLGGKQYKVEKGDKVVVDRLAADEGKTVTLSPVLIGGDKQGVTPTELKGAKVKAKVEEHFLGDKLLVFKYKPKQGCRRRRGHRSRLSRISIQTITAGGAKVVKKAEPEKTGAAAPAKAGGKAGEESKAAAKAKEKAAKAKETGKDEAAKGKKAKAKPTGGKKAKAKPKAKAKTKAKSKAKAKPKAKSTGKKGSGSTKKTEK